MKNWSLVSQFRITLIWIILSTILASFVTYILVAVIFMYGISSEKIYPADYYESQIPLVEDYVRSHSDKGISSLQQEDVSELITGDTIYYQFTDKNGKKLYGTYSNDIFDSKETMYQKINSTFIKDKYYIHTIPIITEHRRCCFNHIFFGYVNDKQCKSVDACGLSIYYLLSIFIYGFIYTYIFKEFC